MAVISAQLVKELREITSSGMMDCKKALEASNGDIDKAIIWLRENGLSKAAKKADRIAAEGISIAKKGSKNAVILEVNSETDFVSKNDKFLKLIDDIAEGLLKDNPKNVHDALKTKIAANQTIEEACINATATIGEKISFRRFAIVDVTRDSTVVVYNHSNSRISTLLALKGNVDEKNAYNIAMHVAAMNPQYISLNEIPQEFKDVELHIINEQKKDELAKKPENVRDNILKGALSKKLAEVTLLEQEFILDESKKIKDIIASLKTEIIFMKRYEVGEGIEKQVVDFAQEVAEQLKGK